MFCLYKMYKQIIIILMGLLYIGYIVHLCNIHMVVKEELLSLKIENILLKVKIELLEKQNEN